MKMLLTSENSVPFYSSQKPALERKTIIFVLVASDSWQLICIYRNSVVLNNDVFIWHRESFHFVAINSLRNTDSFKKWRMRDRKFIEKKRNSINEWIKKHAKYETVRDLHQKQISKTNRKNG